MRSSLLSLMVVLVVAVACAADEVADAIALARSAYGDGEYGEASAQLQKALDGVNRRLMELLIAAMPEPPEGWRAGDPRGIDPASTGAGMSPGLVVTREYLTPTGSSIEFIVAADPPMLASLRVFVSNPLLADMGAESGMKKTSVCGYDAIEDTSDGAAVQILAGESTLISVEGESSDDLAHVRELSSRADCESIAALLD